MKVNICVNVSQLEKMNLEVITVIWIFWEKFLILHNKNDQISRRRKWGLMGRMANGTQG